MDETFVVMESAYVVENNKPVVILYSRNYDDPSKSYVHKFHNFEPYFYISAFETTGRSSPLIKRIESDRFYIDALGRPICKVVTNLPSDVPKVRDMWKWTDMADFVFDKRFLIDKHIRYAYKIVEGEPVPVEVSSPLLPRIVFCDIECVSPSGIFPDPGKALFPIITIQVMDSLTKKIIVFTSDVVKQTGDPCHVVCGDEKDLIKAFTSYLIHIDPDIIGGWNFEQFDIPYLINRAKNIGVSLKGLSRHGRSVTEFSSMTGAFNNRVPGRAIPDMMAAFKKYNIGMGQRESFGLKSVIADHELLDKPNKIYAFEYPDLGVMLEQIVNEERFDELIEYCKNDVVALDNINESLGLYMYFESIRFVAGSKIMDGLFNSKVIEMLLLHEGIRPMPTRVHGTAAPSKFPGALVVSPVAGLHNQVQTVDVSSMYPNIMVGFEVSPDIDGVVVKAMKKIMDLREHYRSLKKLGIKGADALDSGTKAVANSFYGVTGSPAFRLYNKKNALFVTSTGQDINRYIQSECVKLGKSVLYGDTDSVFLSEVADSSEALQIENHLNERLLEWCKEKGCKVIITLKAEKLFKRLLFKTASSNRNKSSKKKYAGYLIWHEGHDTNELSFMGLELKRSDQANITKECLLYFLNTLLVEGNQELAVSKIRSKYADIKNGKTPIIEMSIPKAIRKISYATSNPWVDGIAIARDEYNYIIPEGVKPRLVYLKHDKTVCIDEGFDTTKIIHEVDWTKMADIVIRKKMESYLWSLGLEWNTIVEGQQSLDKWF